MPAWSHGVFAICSVNALFLTVSLGSCSFSRRVLVRLLHVIALLSPSLVLVGACR